MDRKVFQSPYLLRTALCLALALGVYLSLGWFTPASAVTMDTSCNNISNYGFTAGLVYCVQTSIAAAVTQYVTSLQGALAYWEAMAMAVAIAVFGMKMMNSNVQEPIKESLTVGLRIGVGLFFFSQAANIYNEAVNVIGQTLGWVSGGFATINTTCNSTAAPVPTNPSQYTVWQGFDCMFQTILGTAPAYFTVSLVVVVGAAIFSGVIGIIVALLAIGVFFASLFLVARAIYLVLLAYISLAFLAIFTPLIAPLIFFQSDYLTKTFKRWLALIVSTIFQPLFVIAFLSMTIMVDDQFIEGKLSGCVPPTYPPTMTGGGAAGTCAWPAAAATAPNTPEPSAGWGQDGGGICSFGQLFNPQCLAGGNFNTYFANFMEYNTTLFSWKHNGDPQGHSTDGSTVTPSMMSKFKSAVINKVSSIILNAGDSSLAGITRLKNYVPLRQLALVMLAFIFITVIMFKLMMTIPDMASNMTIMAGVNLMKLARSPMEGFTANVLKGAGTAMEASAKGTGLLKGNAKGISGLGSSARAGIGGGWRAAKQFMLTK